MSVLSYPGRGKWGNPRWRGNCSGYIYRDLFAQLKPRTFCDPMVGSGTSVEVAKEMGIEAYGLDLHMGFNILRDSIRERVGKEVNACISHPPYHDIIVYSGVVYPSAHSDDLSRSESFEEFMERLHVALLNQRDAVDGGGVYGLIIGDIRRGGRYHSPQAECIARMPASELRSVLVKTQHNVMSDRREYREMRFPRIQHEYIMLWEKPMRVSALVEALAETLSQAKARTRSTWKATVRQALISLGGVADLPSLYGVIADGAPELLARNPHWREKVRQTLQLHPELFTPIARGTWGLAQQMAA